MYSKNKLKESLGFNFLKLIRPEQWYKNLLIFAALFFSQNLFNTKLMILSLEGFILLIIISSAGYILNDIIDCEKDKLNPKKKTRPIVSGKISKTLGYTFATLLYLIGFILSYTLNKKFFLIVFLLAFLTYIYSIYFKHVIFADILFISTNFVLRALAGVVLIGVSLSIWFLLEIFFFAFFLVAAKRYGDISNMDEKSLLYKPVLKYYNLRLLNSIIVVFMSCVIIIYGLYANFSNNIKLIYLYPIFLYPLLRYYYLIDMGHEYISNPEKFVFEKRDYHLIFSSILLVLLIFIIYYLK